MPLYWLCYRHNNQISVVVEPGASPIHARMRAALANLDEGEFTKGHELDRKWPRSTHVYVEMNLLGESAGEENE
jgi:hypothetical protein